MHAELDFRAHLGKRRVVVRSIRQRAAACDRYTAACAAEVQCRMDALQGYGSSSDSDGGQVRGVDSAPPLQSAPRAQGAMPQPRHDAQPPKPATSGLKLPSANDLFGSPSQAVKYAAVTPGLTDRLLPSTLVHNCLSPQQRVHNHC